MTRRRSRSCAQCHTPNMCLLVSKPTANIEGLTDGELTTELDDNGASMQRYALSVALIVSAVAAHAYAQNVKVDWDRATDFTLYKTYKWTKIPSPRTPTPEIEKLIYSVVDAQLDAKGSRRSRTANPICTSATRSRSGNPRSKPQRRRSPTVPHGKPGVPGARITPPIKRRAKVL